MYFALFLYVSLYLKVSHIRFLMRQYVQIHIAYTVYSILHTIFPLGFQMEFLLMHASRGIHLRVSVMKRVLVGFVRAYIKIGV